MPPARATTPASAYRWQNRQTRFFLNYLKVFLILIPVGAVVFMMINLFVVGVPAAVFAGGKPAGSAAGIMVFVVGAYFLVLLWIGWFWARYAMLFPATAVDQHMTLGEGLRFSKGNG